MTTNNMSNINRRRIAILSLGLIGIGAPVSYIASAQENEADPRPHVEATAVPTTAATPTPTPTPTPKKSGWPTTPDGAGHVEIDENGNLIFVLKDPDTGKERFVNITVPTNGGTPNYEINVEDFLSKIDFNLSGNIENGAKPTYTITIPGTNNGIIQVIVPPNTRPGFNVEIPGSGRFKDVTLTGDYTKGQGGDWKAHIGVKIGFN